MRWAEEQRMKFIGGRLAVQGFINRSHVTSKFGVSVPQASMDLRKYLQLYPNSMAYSVTKKRYEVVRTRSSDESEVASHQIAKGETHGE